MAKKNKRQDPSLSRSKPLPTRVYPRGNQGTFIYAPDIAVYVATDDYGTRTTSQPPRHARGRPHTAVTSEVVMYGYRIVATPRFESVVGLDADEDGAIIPLAVSMAKHAESYSKWQAGNFEVARGAAVAAADL